ncbi:MAG: MmcQ/YjbR family DNA-binding protein [Phyllobacterium sp.]
MDAEQFTSLALSFPETAQGSHMGTTDFRVAGKIFATLRPEKGIGVVALDHDQQAMFCDTSPNMFKPVPGAWGARGWTQVRLETAKADTVRHAMALAWKKTAPKTLSTRHSL